MVKAHLDPEVIKTYIGSSPAPFNPNAADIVVLKRIAIPEEFIIAMLQRDAQLLSIRQKGPAQERVREPPASPGPAPFPPDYQASYPPTPPLNYAHPFFGYYRPVPVIFGSLTSFNNSFPTFINGQAVYTGYYLPGLGF